MKKIVLAFAAVAMSVGFAVNAQDNNTRNCNQTCTEQMCAFEGLNLTDAQKAQLKELGAKKQQARTDKKAEKKAAKQQTRRDFLAEMKTILTPEQYTQFLENSYVNGNKGNFGKAPKGQRNGKRDGQRNKQQRMERGPRADRNANN